MTGPALAADGGMMTPADTVLSEHERLRSLMRLVILTAAEAREGDLAAAMRLGPRIEELRAELSRHAFSEDVHIAPLLATIDSWGVKRRDAIDDAHMREARAAADLRGASGLGQILEHVACIESALASEEAQLRG